MYYKTFMILLLLISGCKLFKSSTPAAPKDDFSGGSSVDESEICNTKIAALFKSEIIRENVKVADILKKWKEASDQDSNLVKATIVRILGANGYPMSKRISDINSIKVFPSSDLTEIDIEGPGINITIKSTGWVNIIEGNMPTIVTDKMLASAVVKAISNEAFPMMDSLITVSLLENDNQIPGSPNQMKLSVGYRGLPGSRSLWFSKDGRIKGEFPTCFKSE